MNENIAIIETSYYFFKNAWITGNLKEAKRFLGLIQKYSKDNSHYLDEALSHSQIKDLQKNIVALQNNLVTKHIDSSEDTEEIIKSTVPDKIIEDEKELHKILGFKCVEQINDILNIEAKLMGFEFPTIHGKCDIVLHNSDTRIPIEVKSDCADHKIVGQIDKYVEHFVRRLNYKIYDTIIGVTIAHRYTKYAHQKLLEFGYIPLIYGVKDDNIILKKI